MSRTEDRGWDRPATASDICEVVTVFTPELATCGKPAVIVGVIDSVTFGVIEFPRCEEHKTW